MSTQTPMLKQYRQIKKEYPDAILFFRLGDFYEMFFEDAKLASKVLGIALTSRNKSDKNPVPLCGVPHHSAEPYLAKLLKSGHKVAVCEQIEDPKSAKGVVRRRVVRVLTPGAIVDSEKLDSKSHNYLASIYQSGAHYGLAYTDISTGLFKTTEFDSIEDVSDELSMLEPKEVLIQDDIDQAPLINTSYIRTFDPLLTRLDSWAWDGERADEVLLEYLGSKTLEPYGFVDHPQAKVASGALIQYLKDTQMEDMPVLEDPEFYSKQDYLAIDDSTKRNLELFKSSSAEATSGSLYWVLDETMTAMGARLLKQWINYPLIRPADIDRRLDAVEEFKNKAALRIEIRNVLKDISDIERLIARICTTSARPRDLGALRDSSHFIKLIKNLLQKAESKFLADLCKSLDDLSDIKETLDSTLVDEPPVSARDGGIIKEGVNKELDGLKSIRQNGKTWIAEMEAREREATGVSTLKVGYNKVFGYYIEISKLKSESVPGHYIRKQTLVNAERFITEELKEYEEKVLGAEDKIIDIEKRLFDDLRQVVAKEYERVRRSAYGIALIDVLSSLSEVAEKYDYVRPHVTESKVLELKNNRHPVIERMDLGERFVPNDIRLDKDENQFLLITGPNMAGKSTLIRQVALTVLMAQIGSFVPSSHARVGITDKIFTRVGASDNLAKGHSTFMVEMVETAYILRHATDRSLVILDEIGRGTSTFDGMSIAWAVAEFLHDRGCRALFATHYHELAELASSKRRIKNYNVYVKDNGEKIVFLRKLIPGAASHSYGIQVAKLAGVPEKVIASARKVLTNLEKSQDELRASILGGQISLFEGTPEEESENLDPIIEEIRSIDTNSMTPLDALTKLAEIKNKLDSD